MAGKEPRTAVTSMRLSETGKYLLEVLQDHLGLSMASVVELLLREEARRRSIPIPGSAADLKAREKQAQNIAAQKAAIAPEHRKK